MGDFRLAIKLLWRSPWYAGSMVGVIGAGVALSAVVFAIVDGVLFKPLPFRNASELYLIDARAASQLSAGPLSVSPAEVEAWTRAIPNLPVTVLYSYSSPFSRRDGVDQFAHLVDERFFDVVGVRPMLGHFEPDDFRWMDRMDTGRQEMYGPIVISYSAWLRDFGGDPAVVGRRVTVSDRDGGRFGHLIRGVLPPGFVFPLDIGRPQPDVLIPDSVTAAGRPSYSRLHAIVRVTDPATLPAIERRLLEATQGASGPDGSQSGSADTSSAPRTIDTLSLTPVTAHLGASARPSLQLIAAGTLLLLLIICLNVTSLITARAADRASTLATRRALGASPWRLGRLVVIEVLTTISAGLAMGLWLAVPMLRLTVSLLPSSLVLLTLPAIDIRVVLAMTLVSAICGGLIALLPAVRAARTGPSVSANARSGRSNHFVKRAGLGLIGFQAAIGFVLVTSGALMIASLAQAWINDAGYQANRTVLLEAFFSNDSESEDSSSRLAAVRSQLSSVAGVAALAGTNIPMFRAALSPSRWAPVGRPPVDGTSDHAVEQSFFAVMGLQPLEGRLPTAAEWVANGPFVVISATASRRMWPGESAIGRLIGPARPGSPPRTVIGVVRDTRYEALDLDPKGSIYFPPDLRYATGFFYVVRTSWDPADVIPGLVAAARDSGLRIERAIALDDALFAATMHRALPAWLFGSLGVVALIVLSVGTFGLLAMAAARRSRELVIRAALGASSTDLIGLLVRDQLVAVAIGVVAGATVSFWTVALLEAQLYRVSPFSPGVWLTSAVVILSVALIATLIPSIRKSRVNPAEALRAE